MGGESGRAKDEDLQRELERLSRKAKRMDAVVKLGKARDPRAIEPLLGLCRRLKRKDREIVCQALIEIASADPAEPVLDLLVKGGLSSKHARVRRCAVCVLGSMGRRAGPAFDRLLGCLDDPDADVRAETVKALGELADPRAVGPLMSLLRDRDRDLRARAVAALEGVGAAALDAVCARFLSGLDRVHAGDKKVVRERVATARVLGRIGGERAVATLSQAFADRALPSEIRVAVLAGLADAGGEQVVRLAAEALRDDDASLRRQAVRSLCHVDLPESTAQLIRLCEGAPGPSDGDGKLRDLALRGLRERYLQLLERVQAGDRDVLPVLLAVWRSMQEDEAKEAHVLSESLAAVGSPLVPALVAALGPSAPGADVIRVLGQMGPAAAGAYPALVAQLDNPDTATCCAAARALGDLGDERAVVPLAARLVIDPGLRSRKRRKVLRRALALQSAAAAALGSLGKTALVPALAAARSDDPLTRQGGAMALGYIGGGQALRALDEFASDGEAAVREAAAEAIERAAAGDVTRLSRLLRDKDERVRAKAVGALGKLDDLRSLDLLLRAYGDPSERVRKAVVKALAQREGERAQSVLVAAAAGGSLSALRVLEEHPSIEAIPALLEALDSPWYEVYNAALRAVRTYVEAFGEGEGRAAQGTEAQGEEVALLRQASPILVGLLHDDAADTRQLALEALGAFRDPANLPDIAVLLLDRKEEIRFAALRIIESIGGEEAEALLQAYVEREDRHKRMDEDLREEIVHALERMRPQPSAAG